MRISDWSSDVCSSDVRQVELHRTGRGVVDDDHLQRAVMLGEHAVDRALQLGLAVEVGNDHADQRVAALGLLHARPPYAFSLGSLGPPALIWRNSRRVG